MTIEKMLPIGTVVVIKGHENEKYMIMGYMPENLDGEKLDYTLAMYPVGVIDSRSSICIKEEAVCKIVFEGYRSDEFELLKKIVDESLRG